MGAECCTPDFRLDQKQQIKDLTLVPVEDHKADEKEQAQPYQKGRQEALKDVLDIDPKVYSHIEGRNEFASELEKKKQQFRIKRYKDGTAYEGELDKNGRPHGLGRLQLKDGSLVIGNFHESVLNGPALYAHKDQVFISGILDDGKLNCYKGLLQAPDFKYEGSFKDNKFDGQGKQTTEDSKFVGEYKEGKRARGRLTWKSNGKDVYQYNGPFNQQQEFEGEGVLMQPFGQYTGSFAAGQKHGHGVYRYSSGLRYEGDYKRGKREGVGKLINKDDTPSYEGQFSDGMPHGSGRSFKNNQLVVSGTFKEGICEEQLA